MLCYAGSVNPFVLGKRIGIFNPVFDGNGGKLIVHISVARRVTVIFKSQTINRAVLSHIESVFAVDSGIEIIERIFIDVIHFYAITFRVFILFFKRFVKLVKLVVFAVCNDINVFAVFVVLVNKIAVFVFCRT